MTREFAVWTSAFERTPEWIPKVSDVFLAKENNTISAFRRKYIRAVNEARNKREEKALTDAEEDLIENNINDLLNLSEYSLPTLEISYNAREEDVADIFVRVNSGGQSLTENNFIQTLISVYENETSDQMNLFCEQSRIPASGTSYNNIIAIEPSHLIRMLSVLVSAGQDCAMHICCYEGKIWKPESILPRSDRRILRSSKKPCSR